MDKITQQEPNITAGENKAIKYSVVIPVYNSADIVGTTIDRTVDLFEKNNWDYEMILVNDKSRDSSWEVVRQKALANSNIVAIDLLRNYGQHTANFCGFQHATGDYVITLDDDLQNPPEDIVHLIDKAKEGHDVVLGQFRERKHATYRCWGSRLISFVNRRMFIQHEGLVLSNFRIIRRDVVDRICAYKTAYPYITGLVLMFASNPINALVEHEERPVGRSNYTMRKIIQLVMRILFNYSSYPLRVVTVFGMTISAASFILGAYYLGRGLLTPRKVPGWTTLVVLVSFFNGIMLLLLGMLGEYLIRLVNQTSVGTPYHIRKIIRPGGSEPRT
ncbi:MAG: glycosyltransferase family 2 protein [Planctomycetota bacterium]|jgi:glycosyltransferase involved in cell wall biosynthesis